MLCCVSLSCARSGADSLINKPILMLKSLEKAVPSVMDWVMHSRFLLPRDAFKVSVSACADGFKCKNKSIHTTNPAASTLLLEDRKTGRIFCSCCTTKLQKEKFALVVSTRCYTAGWHAQQSTDVEVSPNSLQLTAALYRKLLAVSFFTTYHHFYRETAAAGLQLSATDTDVLEH